MNQVCYSLGPLLRYLVIYMGNLEISCAYLMSTAHLQLLGTLRESLDYFCFSLLLEMKNISLAMQE